MLSWGGLGWRSPLRNPCLGSRGGVWARSPPQESPLPVPCSRALPPIFFRPNFFRPNFFRRNFFVGIFSSEFFRPNFFRPIFSSVVGPSSVRPSVRRVLAIFSAMYYFCNLLRTSITLKAICSQIVLIRTVGRPTSSMEQIPRHRQRQK